MKKIALIGSHMKNPAIFGGGSAALEPYYSVSLFDAIKSKLGPDVEITYEIGAYAHKMLPLIDRLMANASITFFNSPLTSTTKTPVGKDPLTRLSSNSWITKTPN